MNRTIRIAFCGILTALGLALMYLAALIPVATLTLPALAGLLLVIPVIEMGIRWALPVFAVTAILSYLFVPDKQAALVYSIFLGYYPIVKALLERLKNKALQWVIKFAVCNAALVPAYFLAVYALGIPKESMTVFGVYMPWVLWLFANGVFALYDIAITGVVVFYIKRLHRQFSNWLKKK